MIARRIGQAGILVGALIACGLSSPSSQAQFATLTRDLASGISSGPHGLFIGDLTPFGGRLLFGLRLRSEERQLWISDGTPLGTFAVPEPCPGDCSAGNRIVTRDSGRYFFVGTSPTSPGLEALWVGDTSGSPPVTLSPPGADMGSDAASLAPPWAGIEIWTSDGTAAGTQRLAATAPDFPVPPLFTASAGGVYFRAAANDRDFELWRTDGTPEGTARVIDLLPGPQGSNPSGLADFLGSLVFFASSNAEQWGLWRTDGTETGTHLVRAFQGAGFDFRDLSPPVVLAERILLAADDGSHGVELWTSDGTPEGTALVADLFRGAGGSQPEELIVREGRVFFVAGEPIHGRELWVTDGTAEGTRLVHDLAPGPASSNPEQLTVAGNRLYFIADDGQHGRELWSLDWTADPTTCPPSESGLCLQNNRFRVEIDWRDFQGNVGRGTPVPLTADTGYFWFFNETNVETIVKVLDGRPINEHFWTFYGALSNVEYTLTVTDTDTGAVKLYRNPLRHFGSVGDTGAF